jgi:prephenate dehydrogenase
VTTADEHDRLLACTSHLPQATAFLLAHALAAAAVPREWLGPGGRDTLRLAASPPPLWTGIALDNADHLLSALAALHSSIGQLQDALQRRDAIRLAELFASGHHWYTSD